MISSKVILWFGFFAALGMIGWGLSGVFTGRIVTKAYGTVDGKRIYYRFVRRDEEPAWFWVLCSIYMTVGIAMMVTICFLLRVPAISG